MKMQLTREEIEHAIRVHVFSTTGIRLDETNSDLQFSGETTGLPHSNMNVVVCEINVGTEHAKKKQEPVKQYEKCSRCQRPDPTVDKHLFGGMCADCTQASL